MHCRIFQLLGIESWFKFKYQSWKIKYISHQKLISRCFAKMLQYKEGKETRVHLIGILIWKYFGLCTLQAMKLHSWKQIQFFAWERYRKAIKKPVFQVILITQWRKIFSKICAFCWIYVWGQISSKEQYSVIASAKAEGVSMFPSYIFFYCTQVSPIKIKENTESKLLVTCYCWKLDR